MIEMPRRSVTRFFIPLIDVLILLFCIFLLMPVAEEERKTDEAFTAKQAAELRHSVDSTTREDYEKKIRDLEQQLAALHALNLKNLLPNLEPRTFEIDGMTGELTFFEASWKVVRDEAHLRALIEQDRNSLRSADQNLIYVVLYPRDRTSTKPTLAQEEAYRRWFGGAGVAVKWVTLDQRSKK